MARLVVSWSGGKDSLLALLRAWDEGHQVCGLLTTVSEPFGRVTMHGVRRELVQAQAHALGLPYWEVTLPPPSAEDGCPLCPLDASPAGLVPNTTYERVWLASLEPLVREGVEGVVFGDVALADVRQFRQRLVGLLGLTAHFPLWGEDPQRLWQEFGEGKGVATVVCCQADLAFLLGTCVSTGFACSLPPAVDPGGEHGEFHTFVVTHRRFSQPIDIVRGEQIARNGFLWQDLRLA
ncbi:MAG: hypothetical protein NZ869_00215 [Thermoanaerobaculum sp.]|nr:hypothetical protein [Thermoanaerobaculum sp.]MDW7968565.1 hypothetical protein [Thermoanaerobaculum sp.]